MDRSRPRLANVGEVLGAGGRVFSMLDMSYVYMDVFLPTGEAGRVELGADARIVLDAQPNAPVPAKVVFVASQNQFTPKMVETKAERDRLMFRVRVRIDPDLARAQVAQIRRDFQGLRMCWLIRVRCGRQVCNPERANDAVGLNVVAELVPVIHVFVGCM